MNVIVTENVTLLKLMWVFSRASDINYCFSLNSKPIG